MKKNLLILVALTSLTNSGLHASSILAVDDAVKKADDAVKKFADQLTNRLNELEAELHPLKLQNKKIYIFMIRNAARYAIQIATRFSNKNT
jgi:hypothetical protein